MNRITEIYSMWLYEVHWLHNSSNYNNDIEPLIRYHHNALNPICNVFLNCRIQLQVNITEKMRIGFSDGHYYTLLIILTARHIRGWFWPSALFQLATKAYWLDTLVKLASFDLSDVATGTLI